MDERTYSLDEVATLIGRSRRTVYARIKAGYLATKKTHGSQRVLGPPSVWSVPPRAPHRKTVKRR